MMTSIIFSISERATTEISVEIVGVPPLNLMQEGGDIAAAQTRAGKGNGRPVVSNKNYLKESERKTLNKKK